MEIVEKKATDPASLSQRKEVFKRKNPVWVQPNAKNRVVLITWEETVANWIPFLVNLFHKRHPKTKTINPATFRSFPLFVNFATKDRPLFHQILQVKTN